LPFGGVAVPISPETKSKRKTPVAQKVINKIIEKSVGNKKLLTEESVVEMKAKHLVPLTDNDTPFEE